MNTRLTLFKATLVQDSALSVSGLDRETTADQPFTIIDGQPILVGRGLKGAAVAMARRFFDPLPRAVSDPACEPAQDKNPSGEKALRRSAWEFANAVVDGTPSAPRLRAGVGIRHKTGARAEGVLYSREVMPAGTKWKLEIRVDRFYTLDDDEFAEAEGILGYVLTEHWAKGRCWLGGGAARGLGWCHVEDLKVFRIDEAAYETWVTSGRQTLPSPLGFVPVVEPTRSWFFRTLDVNITFGEYKPEPDEAPWGLDMFAVGTHDGDRTVQPTASGNWARPAWATTEKPAELSTQRALLMEGDRPLLPGSSVRGALRHTFSRLENMKAGRLLVRDPHVKCEANETSASDKEDPGTEVFGSVRKSSRLLIRDALAKEDWAAAKLHMHAEDEFSAGSYGAAKRDAVRLLHGTFPVRIVVEGPELDEVEKLVRHVDRLVSLGTLGHLPVGGHKTRGAGWGRWATLGWQVDDVEKKRDWRPPEPEAPSSKRETASVERPDPTDTCVKCTEVADGRLLKHVRVKCTDGAVPDPLTLGAAASLARIAFGDRKLVAWWCDPVNAPTLLEVPTTFGRAWPDENDLLLVDEVAFYAEDAVWRAVRTAAGPRFIVLEEVPSDASSTGGVREVRVHYTPAYLLGPQQRFSSARIDEGRVMLREWHGEDGLLGFTLTTTEQR